MILLCYSGIYPLIKICIMNLTDIRLLYCNVSWLTRIVGDFDFSISATAFQVLG